MQAWILVVGILTLAAVILIPFIGLGSQRRREGPYAAFEAAPLRGAKLIVRYSEFRVSNDDWKTLTYDKERGSIVRFDDSKAHTDECHVEIQTFAALLINIYQANLRFVGAQDTEDNRPRVTYVEDRARRDLVGHNAEDGDHGYTCFYSIPRPVTMNGSFAFHASVQTRGAWDGELHLRLDLSNGYTPRVIIPCQVVR